MFDLEKVSLQADQEVREHHRAQIANDGFALGSQIGAIAAMDYCSQPNTAITTTAQWYGAAANLVGELTADLQDEESKQLRGGITASVYQVFGMEKPSSIQ